MTDSSDFLKELTEKINAKLGDSCIPISSPDEKSCTILTSGHYFKMEIRNVIVESGAEKNITQVVCLSETSSSGKVILAVQDPYSPQIIDRNVSIIALHLVNLAIQRETLLNGRKEIALREKAVDQQKEANVYLRKITDGLETLTSALQRVRVQ